MNNIKTTILLTLMMVVFMMIGMAVGGQNGLVVMFFISLAMNFFSYWYSDKIVLKMYGCKEVNAQTAPELVKMVANLAKKANLPMPKVYIMDDPVPNAFATGRNPQNAAVAATSGIMRMLSYEELEGVMAHELSHVKNRDTLISTVASTIAGAIAMLANVMKWGLIFGGSGGRSDENNNSNALVGLAMMIIAPIAAMIIQMAISRSREYLADESGGNISGNPLALASALQKIEGYAKQRVLHDATPATSNLFIINPLSGVQGSFASLFSTHPATSDRVAKQTAQASKMRK